MSEDLTLRPYAEGDEERILALFRRVFKGDREETRWRWQFLEAGAGRPLITIGEHEGALLAHLGIMRQDWSYYGARVPAGQACDAMVDPALRGKGMFSRLFNMNLDQCGREGLAGVLAYASLNTWPSSYTPSVKHCQLVRLGSFNHYHLRTGVRSIAGLPTDRASGWFLGLRRRAAKRHDRRRLGGRLSVEVTARVPDDAEECLARLRAYEVFSVWKDVAYLRWRYEQHPDHKYHFHVLRSEGAIEALAVTRVAEGRVLICELLHRRKNVAQSAFLVREIATRHAAEHRALAVEFYGLDDGFYDAAFGVAGFEVIPFSQLTPIVRPLQSGEIGDRIVAPHNWSLSHGDTDMV